MFSIYCSLFNLAAGFIDWEKALKNFSDFADEVVIATFKEHREDYELLQNFTINNDKFKLVIADTDLNDLAFDGKLKNAALKACTQPFCILLDGDEFISLFDKPKWIDWANRLNVQPNIDALLIPVIDLFNSDKEFKSLGQKWYMHKNLPHLSRGIVNFAKKDNGKIDHTRSDTCELISNTGDICKAVSIFYPDHPSLSRLRLDNSIHVWHEGWLNKQKRLQSNKFWQGVWNNRAGQEVIDIIHSEEELASIDYWPHGLRLWHE